MKLAGKTDIGNQRTENQDSYRAGRQSDDTVWAFVCDGMGGARGGKLAASLASTHMEEVFSNELNTVKKQNELRPFLTQAIQSANKIIYSASLNEAALSGMGTTVVCAVLRGKYLHYAHVGDSRLYLYNSGFVEQLTKDHSMVQELVEYGTITQTEASIHPHKNLITRALGVSKEVQVDYARIQITDGDILLLCSDGLSNCVSSDEIVNILSATPFFECVDALVGKALEHGGQDNITTVLIEVEHSEE